MLIDARALPRDNEITTDVCIIGGGAAGITLARELRGSGLGIVVLESGGLEFEDEIQAVRHRTHPVWGVQFHPESIASEHGQTLLRNFLALG